MSSTEIQKQQALEFILKRLPRTSANLLRYGSALGAIAIIGHAQLPHDMLVIATSIGGNLLASMIDRVASDPNTVSDTEILNTVEAAIAQSGISNALSERSFYTALHQLIQHVDIEIKQLRDFILMELPTREQFDSLITLLETRETNTVDRLQILNERLRLSKGRCVASWQALGISQKEAIDLVNDENIGKPLNEYYPTSEIPLVLLVGDVGIGKTLIAERIYQGAVQAAIADLKAPVPIFIDSSMNDELQLAIGQECEKTGCSIANGALIVIDGLDDQGLDKATEILKQTRIALYAWQQVRVVITSKPIPVFNNTERVIQLPLLSKDKITEIVRKIMGYDYNDVIIYDQPHSITDAIKRPLFAILFAVFMRENYGRHPHSAAELMSNLVSKAVNQSGSRSSDTENLLQQLAVLILDSSNGYVPANEFATNDEISTLFETGLIVRQDQMVRFALPIFTDWFAAQSLGTGSPPANSFIVDNRRLQKWFNALTIFIANYSHARVSELLSHIVETNPVFAILLIKRSLSSWDIGIPVSFPTVEECRKRFVDTMHAWVNGIGELAQLIAPFRADGTIATAYVGISEDNFSSSWAYDEAVSPLLNTKRITRSGKPNTQSAWMWKWTFEDLSTNLTDLLKQRALPATTEVQIKEQIWRAALILIDNEQEARGRGITLSHLDQKLKDIEQVLLRPMSYTIHTHGRDYSFTRPTAQAMRNVISTMLKNGETLLLSPWPMPDQLDASENNWTSYSYSPEQALKRAEAVLEGSLEIYISFVDTWFRKFRSRLEMASTLPATLKGNLYSRGTWQWDSNLSWYLDPLPMGAKSIIDVRLVNGRISDEEWHPVYERIKRLRPHAAHWIGHTLNNGRTDIFDDVPATELAYEWLWADLKNVGWIRENFVHNRD